MAEKHFLTIISKTSFIDLYKYGYMYIRRAINFDGDFDSGISGTELFEKVTKDMNCFEYSFEYLMLHFTDKSSKKELLDIRLNITKVQGIYVFDEEAKREMEISFGSQLQIGVSKWSNSFNNLKVEKYKEQSFKGIDNLWKIFDLNEKNKIECKKIITDEIILETFEELFLGKRPKGDLSIWVYLLRYERHSFYSRNIIGNFCDMIHIVLNKLNGEEQIGNVAEKTKIYKDLRSNDFDSLVKTIEGSENFMMSLKKASSDLINGCKFYVVAPLYLYLREMFSDGIDCKQKIGGLPFDDFVKRLKKYEFDFCVATYMLGLILGYDKTYEAYYSKIGLPILKKKISDVDEVNEVEGEPIENKDSNVEEKVENPSSTTSNLDDKIDNVASTPLISKSENAIEQDLTTIDVNENVAHDDTSTIVQKTISVDKPCELELFKDNLDQIAPMAEKTATSPKSKSKKSSTGKKGKSKK